MIPSIKRNHVIHESFLKLGPKYVSESSRQYPIFLQLRLELNINVLLIKFCQSKRVIVHLSLLMILELRFYVFCHPCYF